MANACPPGQHRTLVMVATGTPVEDIKANPFTCLNCGQAFACVEIELNDPQIEKALKIATEQVKNNLKTLRIKK